jgi:hypothetical protein
MNICTARKEARDIIAGRSSVLAARVSMICKRLQLGPMRDLNNRRPSDIALANKLQEISDAYRRPAGEV